MMENQNYYTVVLICDYSDTLVKFHDVIDSDIESAIARCKALMAVPLDWLVKQAYLQGYKELE